MTMVNTLDKTKRRRLLFRVGAEAGFYSEYNNMLLCMLWCKQHDIEFILSSKEANFAPEGGWNTYFLPFCHELNLPYQAKMNLRYHAPEPSKGYRTRLKRACFSIGKRMHCIDYLTYDVFWQMREQQVTPELITQCRELLKETYRFNPATVKAVQERCQQVQLPSSYVAIHVRRGDKTIEAPHTDLARYMDMLRTHTACKNVFVATDDYTVVEELRLQYAEYQFLTLTPPYTEGTTNAHLMQ